mgnify:FL=1|jgi:hypothetical protein
MEFEAGGDPSILKRLPFQNGKIYHFGIIWNKTLPYIEGNLIDNRFIDEKDFIFI